MTADRAPEGLSEREVMDYAVTIAALLAGRIDGQQAVQTLTAQTDRILADRDARLAEQGAVIARVEALAKLAGEAIARIGGSHTHWREGGAGGTCQTCENANRTREEFALRLAAALRPDPSAQGAGAEGVGT